LLPEKQGSPPAICQPYLVESHALMPAEKAHDYSPLQTPFK
jgi:hypothetical protein